MKKKKSRLWQKLAALSLRVLKEPFNNTLLKPFYKIKKDDGVKF
jgi:hypothetical protein